jgi:RimJ/RimL family protein N-acetyltransferase
LSYDLRSDYWHQGLAIESATVVRDYAFKTLKLPRLVSLIRKGNEASRRVAERVGMTLVDEVVSPEGVDYWLMEVHNTKTIHH